MFTLARERISLRTGAQGPLAGRRSPPVPRIREPRYIDEHSLIAQIRPGMFGESSRRVDPA